jgi:hypothetical protein
MRTMSCAALLATLALALPGCRDMAMPPAGSYSEVLLVTDDGPDDRWSAMLSPIIGREYDYVIGRETHFKVFPMRAADLGDFPVYKNVVICGPLDASTEVGRRIMGLIDDAGAASVSRGEANILKKDDMPAPGQVTIVVTAPDEEALARFIDERGDEVVAVIEGSCRERVRGYLLQRANPELSEELHRKYGFSLQFPYLYVLHGDESSPPGVELIRQPPARVLWVDCKEAPTIYDHDELFDIRADYVWKRYDRDKMDRDRVRYAVARLGPYDAIEMSGYWYNDEDTAGGYFETYFIYDDTSDLLWAVDLVVFAPGRPKHPLVRELASLAETFRHD